MLFYQQQQRIGEDPAEDPDSWKKGLKKTLKKRNRRDTRKRRIAKDRKFMSRHHLTPRSRYKRERWPWDKDDVKKNILQLWDEQHRLWHQLFGVTTLEETILALLEIAYEKGRLPSRIVLPMINNLVAEMEDLRASA